MIEVERQAVGLVSATFVAADSEGALGKLAVKGTRMYLLEILRSETEHPGTR